MSPFEAGMLICFGASWPLDIYKSLKSRSTAGKSVMFMFVLCVGHIFGIINKIVYNHDIVLVLYIINLLLVSVDICLFYRNKRNEARLKTKTM
jgi:lipopolysaccharide export LptBFGC system permease protein LptF